MRDPYPLSSQMQVTVVIDHAVPLAPAQQISNQIGELLADGLAEQSVGPVAVTTTLVSAVMHCRADPTASRRNGWASRTSRTERS